jgi:small subunit ribosomal protein S21
MPTVKVYNDNFEKAMRKFKKQVANSGLLLEVKDRQHYEKPSIKRNKAKAAAKMRWKRYLREQATPRKQY